MVLERMLLVIDECRELSGVSRSELYKAMKRGRLRYRIVGGRRRVTPADLRSYLNNEQ
jgi:excisionase family DNA binding protein